MVCFVVLHYMVVEETINCIRNLKTIMNNSDRIIIVDNNSSNNSGVKLKNIYNKDKQIDIIINSENLGFAKGNNVGCNYAKEKYSPDFYIVMNNDVEIQQKDFIQKIYKIYDDEKFDVLSPDIFSTFQKIHQSPKTLSPMTISKAKSLKKEYEKKLKNRWVLKIRCKLKKNKIINNIKKMIKSESIDYTKKYYNVPLHGACFIFSKKFVNKRKNVFFENTFLYFESEILDYECHLYNFKELYNPEIKVFHNQNVSTKYIYSNELKRAQFMSRENLNSINEFLKQYDK